MHGSTFLNAPVRSRGRDYMCFFILYYYALYLSAHICLYQPHLLLACLLGSNITANGELHCGRILQDGKLLAVKSRIF